MAQNAKGKAAAGGGGGGGGGGVKGAQPSSKKNKTSSSTSTSSRRSGGGGSVGKILIGGAVLIVVALVALYFYNPLAPHRLFFDVVHNLVRLKIEFKEPWTAHAVGSTISSNISSSARALEAIFKFEGKGLESDVTGLRYQLDVKFGSLLNLYRRIPFQSISIKRNDGSILRGELHLPSSSSEPSSTILYLHGGGFAAGSPATYRTFLAELASRSNSQVLAIDYRLAPEHPLPAATEDAVTAFEFLINEFHRNSIPSKIVIGGDSAGGGLTALTLLSLRDQGKPLPSGGFLISPWTDLTCSSETFTSKFEEDLIIRNDIRVQASWATGTTLEDKEDKRRSPVFSPLYANLKGLPRLLIQVGSSERLLDDSRIFAKKAHSQGVDVTYREWQRMQHVWTALYHTIPEGDLALDEIVSFIKDTVSK